MKFFAHLAAVVLGLATVGAQAEVLIYSGTVKLTDLSVRTKPIVRKAFLVTDPGGKSTQLVTYGKFERIKSREEEGMKVGDFFAGALTTGGPVLDIYVFLNKEDGLGLLRESRFLRGTQKTVQINMNQGNPVTASRAKFIRGSVRTIVAALGSSYVEQELTLTFDKELTVDANVRGISAATAYSEITAMLEANGYTNL